MTSGHERIGVEQDLTMSWMPPEQTQFVALWAPWKPETWRKAICGVRMRQSIHLERHFLNR